MTEVADVERTLDELIELGGTRLAAQWPGVLALRRIAEEAASADGSRRDELVSELRALAVPMYGGYGSFLDFGIDEPDAERFERLKDQLLREIGHL